jgi:hypothetical protein
MYGQMLTFQTTPDKRLALVDLVAENSRGEGGHKSQTKGSPGEDPEDYGLFWEKTDILASQLTDAVQFQYTVTGRTRRKKNEAPLGAK